MEDRAVSKQDYKMQEAWGKWPQIMCFSEATQPSWQFSSCFSDSPSLLPVIWHEPQFSGAPPTHYPGTSATEKTETIDQCHQTSHWHKRKQNSQNKAKWLCKEATVIEGVATCRPSSCVPGEAVTETVWLRPYFPRRMKCQLECPWSQNWVLLIPLFPKYIIASKK